MAEENQTSEANNQSAKGGGSGGMLPALLIIVLMPLISFAMFKFMFIPMIKAEIPEPGKPVEIDAENIHVQTDEDLSATKYEFPKSIVANLKGTNMTRFVKVRVTIYGVHPDLTGEIERVLPKLEDFASNLLGSLTLADLEKREIKNVIRNQLKMGFNNELGNPLIDEIYLPEFVVQ